MNDSLDLRKRIIKMRESNNLVVTSSDNLDKNLSSRNYLCGDDYNISDIAVQAWYGNVVLGNAYDAAEFLDVTSYKNIIRWAKEIQERPAYKRGSKVNRPWGPKENQVAERHDASDIK